jgi:cytochrome c-type biogenesis protein
VVSLAVARPERGSSVLGSCFLGAVYALAATACVLPLFLSVTVVSLDLTVGGTALVLVAYASGFAALMLASTVAVAIGQEAILDRFTGHAGTLTRVAGVVLVFAGLAQLYLAFWVAPVNPL